MIRGLQPLLAVVVVLLYSVSFLFSNHSPLRPALPRPTAHYLLFTARAPAISSPYATPCHNTIIHASAGLRWKLGLDLKSDMQNPK